MKEHRPAILAMAASLGYTFQERHVPASCTACHFHQTLDVDGCNGHPIKLEIADRLGLPKTSWCTRAGFMSYGVWVRAAPQEYPP